MTPVKLDVRCAITVAIYSAFRVRKQLIPLPKLIQETIALFSMNKHHNFMKRPFGMMISIA